MLTCAVSFLTSLYHLNKLFILKIAIDTSVYSSLHSGAFMGHETVLGAVDADKRWRILLKAVGTAHHFLLHFRCT